MAEQVAGLLGDERDEVANAGNFSAFVLEALPDVNWAGFYRLASDGGLLLGAFAGSPACTRLPAGEGVCGHAVTLRKSVIVEDVEQFPGHIVCDTASRSELAVPVWAGEGLYGVFDVDSPRRDRFSEADRAGVERLLDAFTQHTDLRVNASLAK